jgi:DNA-binding Lrp family transcriptional regulator
LITSSVNIDILMDSTDRRLISLLRDNARMPVAAMAKSLGLSRGTVQNRLARLEADGTVLGYTVRLRSSADDESIRAFMTVAVEGNRTDEVLRALRGDPAVCALHTTNGRWDIVAELRTESLEAVDRVLGRIRQIDGISNTETSLLLSTHKY